jgi:formylglycine-generating enzyme required for sulfatase activity
MIKFWLQVSRPVDAYDHTINWGILMRVHFLSMCLFLGVAALQSCRTAGPSTTKDIGGSPRDVIKENCQPGKLTDGPNSSKFAQICPGTFMLGSPDSEPGRDSNEGPQHQVTISKAFELQTTEVTQSQWQAVMGSNPSYFKGPDFPVEQVSWDDAQVFIAKLNALGDGYRYRLPTEAEWEYAARAGTTGPYAGDLDAMAWYHANSGNTTHPVATKAPNAWGLYDMHGNVWEWTQDWYGDYSASAVTDPVGPSSGSGRVRRGGGWGNHSRYCRSADRNLDSPDFRYGSLGLRLLRTSP